MAGQVIGARRHELADVHHEGSRTIGTSTHSPHPVAHLEAAGVRLGLQDGEASLRAAVAAQRARATQKAVGAYDEAVVGASPFVVSESRDARNRVINTILASPRPEDRIWDRFERIDLHRWSKSRAAVVGDAANAMSPNTGQGAGTAAMSALSLAVLVSGAPSSIEEGLRRWEAMERPLTEHTQMVAGSPGGGAAP